MAEYPYEELFLRDNVEKQVRITYDGGVITNTELVSESMELNETLCSGQELRFGGCEAATLKFQAAGVMRPLYGQWLTVELLPEGDPAKSFPLGRYKVASDRLSADRRRRDITAHDAMYDLLNTEVADWYHALLPSEQSTVTLRQFRDSFFAHVKIPQEEAALPNDDMTVAKTIEPESLSGRDVLTAICELNGCFGRIGRDGSFRYIFLKNPIQGLYPRNDLYPAKDLYPAAPDSRRIPKSHYISCRYEDYVTHRIGKLQIREKKDDIGAIVGTGDNCYIVEDNFLAYGKHADELNQIAQRLYDTVREISYRPFTAEAKGNPCVEPGDAVRLNTRYEIIESYVLSRTLKGIRSLRDTCSADGVEEYAEKMHSVNRSIRQLKSITNMLERDVDETKSTITDVEKNLQTQISQNVERITLEAGRAQTKEEELSARLTITAQEVTTKVAKNNIISEINQTAEEVKIQAEKISLNGVVTANNNTQIGRDGALSVKNADVNMTNGSINIQSAESKPGIIKLSRTGGISAEMGTDGVRSTDGTRTATFQYSQVSVNGSGNVVAMLTDSGKGISSYGWESYSDRRLKHGVEPLDPEEAAAFVYAQRPCRFRYNYDPKEKIRHGLIAQEVKETLPDPDWALCSEDMPYGEETRMTVNYLELIADLIATVQSQDRRIRALEEHAQTGGE